MSRNACSLNRRVSFEVGDCRHRFAELGFGGDFGGDIGGMQRAPHGPGDPAAEYEQDRTHRNPGRRAGLASNGRWEELFYRAMLYGTTQTQVVPRVFSGEEVARIEAPTLLVLGELERIYRPDKAARAARRLMPSVQVELIPRAHYVTAIANPEAGNACVTAFLGEQDDSGQFAPGA